MTSRNRCRPRSGQRGLPAIGVVREQTNGHEIQRVANKCNFDLTLALQEDGHHLSPARHIGCSLTTGVAIECSLRMRGMTQTDGTREVECADGGRPKANIFWRSSPV